MNTSAAGYAFVASGTLLCRGMATSSRPKNTFWKPPGLPGCTTHATEGVSRPASHAQLWCPVSFSARTDL